MSAKYTICYICTMFHDTKKHQKSIFSMKNVHSAQCILHIASVQILKYQSTTVPRHQDALVPGYQGAKVPGILVPRCKITFAREAIWSIWWGFQGLTSHSKIIKIGDFLYLAGKPPKCQQSILFGTFALCFMTPKNIKN